MSNNHSGLKSERGYHPALTLNNGQQIPVIGMGTFGSDKVSANDVAEAVKYASSVGFRFFDCASVYGNESVIGSVFSEIIKNSVPRKDLFISSKVWNDQHHNVVQSCKQSLHDLKLDYLDLYLVHWPFSNYHPPGCSVDSRSPDATPFSRERYLETWTQMESLVKEGLVRGIGTSNMTIPKMDFLLAECSIIPAVNEMECHPHFQQPELYRYLVSKSIQPIGFCPVGSPQRPERDRTDSDTSVLEDPVVNEIAHRLKVHPAVVCLKWAIQRGHIPIPFSANKDKIKNNYDCLFSEPLSEDEMTQIALIDRGNRLIKGQVFLWEDAKGWEDLWDMEGHIQG